MKCSNCQAEDEFISMACENCGQEVIPEYIRKVQVETHAWRLRQFGKVEPTPQLLGTMVELAEMGDMLVKAEYYDDDWADDERLKEEAGDVMLYLLGVMSCLDFDVMDCIEAAQRKNSNRNWETHMQAPDNEH